MRVKLLIAMAFASLLILAGTVTAVAGTGIPCSCNVPVYVQQCCPCPIAPPCIVTPGCCQVQLAECHAPVCNVQCDCPQLNGVLCLSKPSSVGFCPPSFKCPSVSLCGPCFTCPKLFDP